MKQSTQKKLEGLIKEYNKFITSLENKAKTSSKRAFGGVLRSFKGKFVEMLAKSLIEFAWNDIKSTNKNLTFCNEIIKVPIKREYIDKIQDLEVKQYILKNIKNYFYPMKSDIHICIDEKFVLAFECKAYTENAMFKRILVDFSLLKNVYPDLKFVVFQLESQLGGDYSEVANSKFGSPSTHTLLSYFDVDLTIITLLEGERKVDEPIHKKEHFKILKVENLIFALETFKNLLTSCLKY